MIDYSLIVRLNKKMKQILNAELAAGNEVRETFKGGFSKASPDHIFVFLKYPFMDRYDIPGIIFREIEDRHYWRAEYDDDENNQTIACNY